MDSAPTRQDTVVAATCAVAGALTALLRARTGVGWAPLGVELAAQTAASALLLLRARRPLLVLSGCAVASLVSPPVAVLGAAHAVGLHVASVRVSLCAVLAVVAAAWPSLLVTTTPLTPALLWVANLVLLASYAAGRLQRQQAEADQRAAAVAVDRARSAERSALARDLHDVVSRRMSYAVVEAEVLGAATADDEVRRASAEIAGGCRAALAEMRTVLQVLSGDGVRGEGAAGPDGSVEALVTQARAAGQPVRLTGAAPLRTPPGLVDRTVLRVVGEGLTNAVRHAPGAPTTVDVSRTGGQVRVTVENDRPERPPTGLTTGGFGLSGLRERLALLGGVLEAGPTVGGGFRLRAVLTEEAR